MLRYVFKEIKRNKLLRVISVLQLSAALLMIMFMISGIMSRYKYYKPLEHIISNKGFVVTSNILSDSDNNIFLEAEDLKRQLNNVENIYTSHSAFFTYDSGDTAKVYGYDDELFSSFPNDLDSGKWYSDADPNNIHAVIANNCDSIDTGDIITIHTNSGDHKITITGVLEEGGKLLGNDSANLSNKDCTFESLYINKYNDKYMEQYLLANDEETKELIQNAMKHDDSDDRYNTPELYMSYTELKKISSESYLGGNIFITLNKDSNGADYHENYIILSSYNGVRNIMDMETLKDNSIEYINSQVYTISPLLISIFLLSIVTSCTICIISSKKMLNIYSVFFLCGSSWMQLIKINLCSNIISVCLSIITSAAAIIVMKASGFLSQTVIEFGIVQVLAAVTLMLFYILISIIIPYAMMKNHTPKEIITHKL